MNILLTNDDGIDHSGIKSLFLELDKNHNVFVMAPDRNRSGFGSAITFLTETNAKKLEENINSLDGTPVDCVKNALEFYCPFEPDIVVSGINPGPNLGHLMLYSGTVGAAIQGRDLKHPSIAISVSSFEITDYSFAAKTVLKILENITNLNLSEKSILNVNVPDHNLFKQPKMKVTKTFIDEEATSDDEIEDDVSSLESGNISSYLNFFLMPNKSRRCLAHSGSSVLEAIAIGISLSSMAWNISIASE